MANLTESRSAEGSIITDYQYEQNTYSDQQFMKDAIEEMGEQENKITVVTDGAYGGAENIVAAKEKNIELITTNLTGRAAEDILAEFEFNEDGSRVIKCANGIEPKSNSYNQKTGQCVVSFKRDQCESCPFKDACHPKMNKKTARKVVSIKGKIRAEQQRMRGSEKFSAMTKYRNGVEALPSLLRRRYKVDQMPVRGKKLTKLYFGLKVGALNISKFCEAMKRRDKCAQKQKEEEKWAKANAENERAIGRTVLSLEYILTNHFNQVKMHFTKYAFDA